MSRLIEELIRDERHDDAVETAQVLIDLKKLSLEEISLASKLSLEEVKTLAAKQSV